METIFNFLFRIDIHHYESFSMFGAINIQYCRLLLIPYQYLSLWTIFDFW